MSKPLILNVSENVRVADVNLSRVKIELHEAESGIGKSQANLMKIHLQCTIGHLQAAVDELQVAEIPP